MSEEIQEKGTDEQVDTQQENAEETKPETGRTFTRADVAKMIAAERSKWESEQSEAIEKAKSEGERLAKQSKDERSKEEENKRLSAIEERERAVAEKEMRIETQFWGMSVFMDAREDPQLLLMAFFSSLAYSVMASPCLSFMFITSDWPCLYLSMA